MAHEICDFVESEKIRRLYYGSPKWYDLSCQVRRSYLNPGHISITPKEERHIRALFDAINEVSNGHGVEPA